MRIECANPLAVVQEAFWLAWLACQRPDDKGVFDERPDANKQSVWDAIVDSCDDAASSVVHDVPLTGVYCDHVFGRMVNLGLKWDDTAVITRDDRPDRALQAWCRVFRTYESLVRSAIESLAAERAQ